MTIQQLQKEIEMSQKEKDELENKEAVRFSERADKDAEEEKRN